MTHEELLECAMDLAIEAGEMRQGRALVEEYWAELVQDTESSDG